ncbi:DUF2780 domain-containing protein [Pseudomonas schmalbachii]|uniref:DUF2780 domain-containing protein n=1 Tax=Pseudomonas schmalbachii TaxID=2816993 RepID=A0ABS3TW07_9PSED|nr:DUF2780 domain-containing protein [Pseudomonas schmalbachii]MBO3277847.1 DUF2780 domain-containing protein [Pseudomonas schmalbachii]
MTATPRFALAIAALLAASSVFAYGLGDAAKAVSGATGGSVAQVATTPEASGLLSALTGQLGVTDQQALGGTGALLGLAKNKLSGTDYSQLLNAVPGLDKLAGGNALGGSLGNLGGSALGNVSSMADVNKAFGALGMDQGMTGKFAGVLLDYLGKQGAGGDLLGSLGSLWGVGG